MARRMVRHRGCLDYPLRRVVWQRRTTGTLTDPSHYVLSLDCGHQTTAPLTRGNWDRKFARCEECAAKDRDKPLTEVL